MSNSIASTLDLLQKEFPNLEWKGYHRNIDEVHFFTAEFCGWWKLMVQVLPNGCMAILSIPKCCQTAGSPNEPGKTLEEVVSYIRNEWDKIAHAMSK